LLTVATALLATTPSQALSTCGSKGQPACTEEKAPGVTLTLSAAENPKGLQPLAQVPSADKPLWPRVRGHKPYGMNAVSAGRDGTTVADEASLHEQMGASMARVGVDWAMIQYYPNAAAGGPSWNYQDYLDPIYRAYVRRGIRPLLTIQRTPRRFTKNASTAPNSNVMGCGTSDACWNPPVGTTRLSTFAADVAKRYPLAAGVEVWNEPNLSNPFWGGEAIDPARYAAMVGAVSSAVKARRPAWPVIAGATAPFASSGVDNTGYPVTSARTFMKLMLKAGAASSMDAVSIHPYLGSFPSWTTDTATQNQALYGAMIAGNDAVRLAYADAGVAMNDRIVVTEMGASTTDGFTPDQQSWWTGMHFALLDASHVNIPLSDRTDAAFIHTTVDQVSPDYGNAWQAGYGLVRSKSADGSFAPKPVFCWFRTNVGGFSDCPATLTTTGS
jgi:hypothetical protein